MEEDLSVEDQQHIRRAILLMLEILLLHPVHPGYILHVCGVVPPAAAHQRAEIVEPHAAAAQKRAQHELAQNLYALLQRIHLQAAKVNISQMGRLVHLVQPQLAMQVHRLYQPARQCGAAWETAVLVVGLRRTKEIDIRGGENILLAKVSARRLTTKQRKVIAVETADCHGARPVFPHNLGKAKNALRHHLVLAFVIVGHRLLLLRVAEDAG